MIRGVLLVCAVLLLGLVSAYAFVEAEAPSDFRYVNPAGVHTLDPARMSWTPDLRVAANLWEGLTATHPRTAEPIEGAAHFPPAVSGDGLKYTFRIREDSRWSNGEPVTAGDFIRGWRRVMEPGTGADYTFLFTEHIAGAAEYVSWRLNAVSVLTALSRLRDGWDVDARQADALCDLTEFESSCGGAGILESHGTTGVNAQALRRLAIDWAAVYDRFFADYTSQLNERFAEVGVSASDNRTLVVKLTHPCPYFKDLTAFPTLMPIHESIELLRERYRGKPITAEGLVVYDPQWTKPDYHRSGYPGLVTNGPYRPSEWTFKRRLRMEVNPFYRAAGDIACRTIDMVVFNHASAAIMAYEAGDVDFLPSMDVPYDHEIARLARSGQRPDFYLCDLPATYFFNFNCASDKLRGRPNPLLDPRVRQALSIAVDKRAIVENVLGRGDRVAHTFVPPGFVAGYVSPRGATLDAAKARQLLAEAGFPGGKGLPPVELLYVPADQRICQAVARMWEDELGITVELRSKESKTFAEDKANHRYMVARGNWYADYRDPTTFLNCLTTGNGNNDSGYSNPKYDGLIRQANETRDPALRAEILAQAERVIVEEDFPIVTILHYVQPMAIARHVKGLYPDPRLRFPFQYINIER